MQIKIKTGKPKLGDSVFVAPTAALIGDVQIGERSSVWFNTSLRGDVMPIKIGIETNIQDGTVIHGTYKKAATTIGDRVTVGHAVILHGTTIGDKCLIGMGALLMDNSKIGKGSIVAAGSLVTEGSEFPPNSLIMGRPAKLKRSLREDEIQFLDKSADNYLFYTTWYDDMKVRVD